MSLFALCASILVYQGSARDLVVSDGTVTGLELVTPHYSFWGVQDPYTFTGPVAAVSSAEFDIFKSHLKRAIDTGDIIIDTSMADKYENKMVLLIESQMSTRFHQICLGRKPGLCLAYVAKQFPSSIFILVYSGTSPGVVSFWHDGNTFEDYFEQDEAFRDSIFLSAEETEFSTRLIALLMNNDIAEVNGVLHVSPNEYKAHFESTTIRMFLRWLCGVGFIVAGVYCFRYMWIRKTIRKNPATIQRILFINGVESILLGFGSLIDGQGTVGLLDVKYMMIVNWGFFMSSVAMQLALYLHWQDFIQKCQSISLTAQQDGRQGNLWVRRISQFLPVLDLVVILLYLSPQNVSKLVQLLCLVPVVIQVVILVYEFKICYRVFAFLKSSSEISSSGLNSNFQNAQRRTKARLVNGFALSMVFASIKMASFFLVFMFYGTGEYTGSPEIWVWTLATNAYGQLVSMYFKCTRRYSKSF